jgi:hypothetical protein
VKSFDYSPEKKNSDSHELDSLPLSALRFTREPEVAPKMKFNALFGSAFSKEGPPINKPKDAFGFDF